MTTIGVYRTSVRYKFPTSIFTRLSSSTPVIFLILQVSTPSLYMRKVMLQTSRLAASWLANSISLKLKSLVS